MKIKYRHVSKPDEVRICDSVKQRKVSQEFGRMIGIGFDQTQEQYDDWLLKKFEEDKRRGVILSFGVAIREEETK